MLWVWANDATGQACVYGEPIVLAGRQIDFDTGAPLGPTAPRVPLTLDAGTGRLTDSLLVRGLGVAFSSRLRGVLQDAGIDNVEYWPIVLAGSDAVAGHDHCLANVVGRVSCLDLRASVVERAPFGDEAIEFIDVLAIDEARAGGFQLFRLHEDPRVILAGDRVRRACTREGITGVTFVAPGGFGRESTRTATPPFEEERLLRTR